MYRILCTFYIGLAGWLLLLRGLGFGAQFSEALLFGLRVLGFGFRGPVI